ncbi:MAG: hypothetical protein OZ921_22050 [Sorangiineae bacterium]|nr:hypothetical protein [Polyangiaceae bacterium]MEB2325212.1 hypothetical protein [Sorangiineae bacterium]
MASEEEHEAENEAVEDPMMPEVPEDVDVDPMLLALLHTAAFLDFSDDTLVHPDAAGDVLEHVGLYVQRLPPERLDDLGDQLEILAEHGAGAGWPPAMLEFVRDFLFNCGLDGDEDEERDDDDADDE